jgi:UDP-2-acetamido-3-amino-2,3-dideoxy-glucuronate N-acetyltransferase
VLKKGCSIGANATIVCGNTIGDYAFVGAGAVVIKDVPDYALIVGNPSRQIGWVSKAGHKLIFDSDDKASCPETMENYLLDNNIVSAIKQ